MRTCSPRATMVRLNSVVLPAPGPDMRLTARTPAAANAARLPSATRSFSDRIFSSTATRDTPVST